MGFQLVIVRGRGVSQYIKLPPTVVTLGRHQECQIRVASSQVSRKHCQLFEKQGLLLVKDLGSSNGTYVNGKKVTDQQVLSPGDELSVGSVKFRVEKTDAAPAKSGASGKAGDTVVTEPVVADSGEVALADDEATRVSRAAAKSPVPASVPGPASPQPDDSAIEVSEEDVAEYLLDIELDDEDKL